MFVVPPVGTHWILAVFEYECRDQSWASIIDCLRKLPSVLVQTSIGRLSPIFDEPTFSVQYSDKKFVAKPPDGASNPTWLKREMWEAVERADQRRIYQLVVTAGADVSTTFEEAFPEGRANPSTIGPYDLRSYNGEQGDAGSLAGRMAQALSFEEGGRVVSVPAAPGTPSPQSEPSSQASTPRTTAPPSPDLLTKRSLADGVGCTLLHLGGSIGELATIELLLQYGADVNRRDGMGRTPLHHCIMGKNNAAAKLLLSR